MLVVWIVRRDPGGDILVIFEVVAHWRDVHERALLHADVLAGVLGRVAADVDVEDLHGHALVVVARILETKGVVVLELLGRHEREHDHAVVLDEQRHDVAHGALRCAC